MASDPLTVLVLGTGRMAHRHAQALAKIRAAPDVIDGVTTPLRFGIYGRDKEKLRTLFDETSADFCNDHLDGSIGRFDVDVVDNCLVNRLHFEPLMHAIEEGKHVFTDKPLGGTLDDSVRLRDAAQAAGVTHGIIQNMRFQAGPAAAKQVLESGELGRVFHARVVFGYFVPRRVTNRPAWFFKRAEAEGGVVHDMMSHFYDLLGVVDRTDSQHACAHISRPCRARGPGVRPVHQRHRGVVRGQPSVCGWRDRASVCELGATQARGRADDRDRLRPRWLAHHRQPLLGAARRWPLVQL